MGIRDLGELLKSKNVKYLAYEKISNASGYRIAIDFMLWLVANSKIKAEEVCRRRKGNYFKSSENFDYEVMLETMRACFDFNRKLISYNILPVWILDGKAHKMKADTQSSRLSDREVAMVKLAELDKISLIEMSNEEIRK